MQWLWTQFIRGHKSSVSAGACKVDGTLPSATCCMLDMSRRCTIAHQPRT